MDNSAMKNLKIAIGADHGGFELKSQLLGWLRDQGCAVQDCGTHSKEAVDYPRIAYTVARLVASGQCDRGIMIDGAGIGSAMTANKVRGVRAAACYSVALAKNSREHNDANVLTLGAGQTNFEQATPIVEMFLTAECVEERHRKRVQLINAVQEGPIEVGPHQATLLAGAGEPRPAPAEPDLEKIAKRVQELLAAQGKPITAPPAPPPLNIPQLIDHTILRPDTTRADIEQLCREARQHKFYSVCVNPTWVSLARRLLEGSGVKVCCVVGFPLGAQPPETKAMEARAAIRQGAKEIDMVMNVGTLKSGDDALVLRDICSVVEACRDGSAKCKVILETSLLTNEEKGRARAGRQSRGRFCEDLNRIQHGRGDRRRRGANEPDRAREEARSESIGWHPFPGRPATHGAGWRDPHRHQQRHQDPAGGRRPSRQLGWRKVLGTKGETPWQTYAHISS